MVGTRLYQAISPAKKRTGNEAIQVRQQLAFGDDTNYLHYAHTFEFSRFSLSIRSDLTSDVQSDLYGQRKYVQQMA